MHYRRYLVAQRFKHLLTLLGARFSARMLHQLQMVVNYLKLGGWMARHGYRVDRRLAHRLHVFAAVAAAVRDRRVLYLEFGVYRGDSMRFWAQALSHPEASLHGFDSFEGLPEPFDVAGPYERGTFDVGGAIPQLADPRVRFFKGWFDQTLPTYQPPPHDVLVVNLDADLFSSTRYVLEQIGHLIVPGSYIYLDEMSRPDHEPRALAEFLATGGRRVRVFAADYSLNHVAFICES